MSDRHTFITGTRVKSDGDGITVKEGSAIIFGNIVETKGNGIVIGNSDSVQSNEPKEPAYDIYTRTKQWWEKPVGILRIGILTIVLGAAALWVLNHYFSIKL
jgi:hypothetical protein